MPGKRTLDRGKVVCDLVIFVIKNVASGLLRTDLYTSSADRVLVLMGIWTGQADGRPMTAAKLSEYMGMPRGTIIRKVAELKALGLIRDTGRGRLCIVFNASTSAAINRCLENDAKHIHSASRKLSRMDSS